MSLSGDNGCFGRLKRITFVAGTLDVGGAERQLTYLARVLRRMGWEVQVATLGAGGAFENALSADGIEVTRIGRSPSRLARCLALSKLVRQFDSTIVQSQHFYANLYAGLCGRILSRAAIGAVRSDGRSELAAHPGWRGAMLVRLPKCLAVNSRNAMRNLVRSGVDGRRLFYLPNVVPLRSLRRETRREGRPFQILGVGRLVASKRWDRFLRVLRGLARSGQTSFEARIAGDGPERQGLEVMAGAMGLSRSQVRFLGEVLQPECLYDAADVLLHVPDAEGTPNVVLEAMAGGVPVIATQVGGIPDLVENGAGGFLAEPADEEALVQALDRLMTSEELQRRLGEYARASVARNHSETVLEERLRSLHEQVLGMATGT